MLTSFRSDLKPFEELARSFAARELAKDVEERDRHPFGEFSHGLLDKAFEVGFLGVVLPEKQGGIGGGIDLEGSPPTNQGAMCEISIKS
mgnify:CR=1 FL=1